ncbi:PREDICTED: proline-rich receptor-like protein kinase PERK10 [Branchiostoma belcheri]|uniref:Proline-rich receptor-like protein kinase PERK10 n=1 Tax=Branchiostoma belcheri TaxID=7741 RepID=A0A6P4XN51_BRABE|nr:PREDICTED: proline-rich receptor-like protein kinase PERK10 [Branchiostoma belcheri]
MADPRETLEGEEIEMSVLQGGFNRQDPEVPPPLPPKQSRQDPSCRPKQTWTDPSCRPKQTGHSGQIPENPTPRARRRGGRKTRKEPSRPPDQTLELPTRSTEQASGETSLPPEQSPGPSRRFGRRGGRRAWKVPIAYQVPIATRHKDETPVKPPRPPEQAPDEPSVTPIRPKQRDGKTAGVYRHRLREEDLVKAAAEPNVQGRSRSAVRWQ